MSCINEQTKDFWQEMATKLSVQRPSVGKLVRVVGGRKYKGKEGVVIRHEHDRFDNTTFRYGNDASMHMREMEGKRGFACLVRTHSGEQFWVKASQVECVLHFSSSEDD